MNLLYHILIFCLVLFIYLHVYFQLKTSNDLEIYEIEQPSKEKLEEICDLKQPVVFDFYNERLIDSCRQETILATYGAFDVKIRNIGPLMENSKDDGVVLYVPIAFSNAVRVIGEDTDAKYLVERNGDFLEETGLEKTYKHNDLFLRPPLVAACQYDFIMGSKDIKTPLRYEVNYRTYFLITEGDGMRVKLFPPKSAKYLYPHKDYELMEFRSPVDPWNIQESYKTDFDKIKGLELTVKKGQVIFVPAYWWYSFTFNDPKTSICVFKYRTYMNIVAILPHYGLKFLQNQNITRKNILTKPVPEPVPVPTQSAISTSEQILPAETDTHTPI